MSADHAALATHALGLGREPWNDPASRRRGRLQHLLRTYERARLRAAQEIEDLDERISSLRAELEAAP